MSVSGKYRNRWAPGLVCVALACGALASALILSAPISVAAADASTAATDKTSRVRILTPGQYRRVIEDVFGPNIDLGGRFEPIPRKAGLVELGTGGMGISDSGIEQYDAMARHIAEQVIDGNHRSVLLACKPASAKEPDAACAEQFLSRVGRLLFRRPLAPGELKFHLAVADQVARQSKDFYEGLESSLATMLESPQFLYRTELTELDPDHRGQTRLTSYAKATRLSFLFWDTTPDSQLLDVAETGELNTSEGLKRQVDRMLASSRLEAGVRAFFSDMLGFQDFQSLEKDAALYPKFTSYVANEAQEQTLRTIVDLLLAQRGDYRDLFTTRKTFLTQQLGSIYKVPVVKDAPNGSPDRWVPHEYAEGDPRAGILAQAGFVSLHSHEGRTSPTIRGKALRELIMCQKVPAPPGNVEFKILQDTKNPLYKTTRERLAAHATEAMCTGCHKIMDPAGLAFENFDSDGSYRLTENGNTIDPSGVLNSVPFKDAAGLGQVMHDNPATAACLVTRISAYGLGREPGNDQADWVMNLQKRFTASRYRLPDLMRQLATSPEFYRIPAPTGVREAALN